MRISFGNAGAFGYAVDRLFGALDQARAERRDTEARARTQRIEEEKLRSWRELDAASKAETAARLASVGVRRGKAPEAPGVVVPAGVSPTGVTGLSMVPDTGRYTQLTDDYFQDRNATPEFQQAESARAQQRAATEAANAQSARQSRIQQMIARVMQGDKAAVGELAASGYDTNDLDRLNRIANPEPKAPVRGTKEWFDILDREEGIRAKHRPAPRDDNSIDREQRSWIAQRARELMKPRFDTRTLKETAGLSRAEAFDQAADEWQQLNYVAGGGRSHDRDDPSRPNSMPGAALHPWLEPDSLAGRKGAGGTRSATPRSSPSDQEILDALRESGGDQAKALQLLRRKGYQ